MRDRDIFDSFQCTTTRCNYQKNPVNAIYVFLREGGALPGRLLDSTAVFLVTGRVKLGQDEEDRADRAYDATRGVGSYPQLPMIIDPLSTFRLVQPVEDRRLVVPMQVGGEIAFRHCHST